ncbi:MAG: phosphoribosylglycinamide formyltransferase [Oscillospiraceae bacterium]|nr:phosphoribosylglycinamide formyltransferase [Oscillospiraceae bacterium]MDE6776681.1 phosphoribosylglycinamide formyltransferase [Oscillospiraceae bacterium]
MKNIIVLVSGGGTNLQALIDKQEQGEIKNGNISCVISSNPNAYALQRAEQHGIKTHVLPRKNFENNHAYSLALLDMLKQEQADLIVLAGFMIILDKIIIQAYENKIINVHPALIPAFCGDGFYGLHVHEKALEKGVKLTGATVHFVNEICDGGAIILQKAVAIQKGDTPEILQKRVMEQAEWQILPQAVSLFCEERLEIENNHVWIID